MTVLILGLSVSAALGQGRGLPRGPVYVESGPMVTSTLYADGREVDSPTWHVWRPMCGSDMSGIDEAWLRRLADDHRRAFDGTRPFTVLSAGGGACGGLDIVFNLSGTIPDEAPAALEAAAQYIECQFADPVSVLINVTFADLGEGVIGGAGIPFSGRDWPDARPLLIADMDADDTIQAWLPVGATIPVRWNADTTEVSDEAQMFITLANWLAAIGPRNPPHGSMTFSNQFAFDFDPTDGVDGDKICFQTVVVHEVTHVLGFASVVDILGCCGVFTLDLYRFQLSDGPDINWNPDTLAELQTTARLLDFNNPDDDVICDLIDAEYRMADGNPHQAGHFRFEEPPIGIMDPNLAHGETFWPNFYRTSDLTLLDAIGWDYVAVACADLDGDGAVRVPDLIILLAAWGPCPGDCPSDFDGDGEVRVPDLILLLAGWGEC